MKWALYTLCVNVKYGSGSGHIVINIRQIISWCLERLYYFMIIGTLNSVACIYVISQTGYCSLGLPLPVCELAQNEASIVLDFV